MKELIDERTFIALLTAVSLLLLVVGILLAAIAWRKKKQLQRTAGIALAISGPALWLLWLIYNGVVKHFGLDSVKGLLVNLAIFAVVGIAFGLVVGLLNRQRRAQD